MQHATEGVRDVDETEKTTRSFLELRHNTIRVFLYRRTDSEVV